MSNADCQPRADIPGLLKRLYRFRRQQRGRGLARLLARKRRAGLRSAFARHWRGGYVLTDAGELAFVPAPLDARGERVLFYGFAEPKAALAFVPLGGMAIDVGANLGEWSVPLAKTVGRQGRVLCIEPNTSTSNALTATLRINNLPQAEVMRVALSESDGSGHLLINARDTGLSRLTPTAGNGAVAVPLRRLDTIIAARVPPRLDLIKIDVEGHERQVLAGAADTLRQFRPAIVFESGHETPNDRQAIASLLDNTGYDIVAVMHDYGALTCCQRDYVVAAGACAGTEARNLLALPRPITR
jgi:FkbM family methyltransferase